MKFICDKSRHLICEPYSVTNLHEMADQLNIKRCWYHSSPYPHYDIPKRRIAEITSQCHVITSKEIVRIIKRYPEI